LIDKVIFSDTFISFDIKVIPNSKKNSIDFKVYPFKIHIVKPAVDNKANKEVVLYLKKIFKVKKTDLLIVKGEKNRNKVIKINNLSKNLFLKAMGGVSEKRL